MTFSVFCEEKRDTINLYFYFVIAGKGSIQQMENEKPGCADDQSSATIRTIEPMVSKSEDGVKPNASSSSTETKQTERGFHKNWLRLWERLLYDHSARKMSCKHCMAQKKENTFTKDCTTLRTSSVTRHEETEDHQRAMAAWQMRQMVELMKKANAEEDESIVEAMKVVYYLAAENIALRKYGAMMQLRHNLDVPEL